MASAETSQNIEWFFEKFTVIKIKLQIVEMCRQITEQHLNISHTVLMVKEDSSRCV